jgi:hypothetical protein
VIVLRIDGINTEASELHHHQSYFSRFPVDVARERSVDLCGGIQMAGQVFFDR